MRILVSGSTGLIGTALVEHLLGLGHQVGRLVRGDMREPGDVRWNPGELLAPEVLANVDAIVNLSGANVGSRWSAASKRKILDSRVKSTRTLAEAVSMAQSAGRTVTLISASAIGYYGSRGDEVLTEESKPGVGFLAEVCQTWEQAADPARQAGARVVHPRIGLVLSQNGGALGKMLPAFKAGVAGRMGSGRQYWSWISHRDVVGAITYALTNVDLSGPVNLVAPNPVSNAEFTKTLAHALHRPAVVPMPATAVRLAFGEMGEQTILASQRVQPKRLLESGYQFQDPELDGALANVLGSEG
jgi:uncharacterized protein (TIGR01777 family)